MVLYLFRKKRKQRLDGGPGLIAQFSKYDFWNLWDIWDRNIFFWKCHKVFWSSKKICPNFFWNFSVEKIMIEKMKNFDRKSKRIFFDLPKKIDRNFHFFDYYFFDQNFFDFIRTKNFRTKKKSEIFFWKIYFDPKCSKDSKNHT